MNSTVRMVQKRILNLFKKGLSADEVMEEMNDEDADLLGHAWSDLRKKNKIPPTSDERKHASEERMQIMAKHLIKLAKEVINE